MKRFLSNSAFSIVTISILTGCGGNKLDVLSYPTKIKNKVQIPQVCIPEYKSAMPTVAVIDFTNNSTFGKANINETKSNSKTKKRFGAVGGVGVSPYGVGLGVAGGSIKKTKSNTTNTQRTIDSKLSSSVTGPIESLVVNSGGAKLFTRSDMDKIDAELKFQDSGLIDPDSAVEFGKTSGVRYIITGSIDNVDQNLRNNSDASQAVGEMTKQSDKKSVQLFGSLLKLGTAITDGMTITTKLTVKMLDVQTGKIVFSRSLEESENIGKITNPNFDQIVGAIKQAMINALPRLEEDFSNYFAVKGYITQIKTNGSDIVAQVNIGRDFKVVENQIFTVYEFDEIEDPISGRSTCDVIQTPIKLRASHQIRKNSTWVTVHEGDFGTLKLGQLIQKSHKKVSSFEISSF